MPTPAQIEANRRNAQRSTGPKTPEGKAASSQNARTHGLSATTLPPTDQPALDARIASLTASYKPRDDHQRWLVAQIAVAGLHVEQSQALQRAQDQIDRLRAPIGYDLDRDADAEDLLARLAKNPPRILVRLKKTSHGVKALLDRWHSLRRTLESHDSWTEPQAFLAARLLGAPDEVVPTLADKLLATPEDALHAIASREIESLHSLKSEKLDPLAALERDLANQGILMVPSKDLRRLMRHEADAWRTYHWALNELQRLQAEADAQTESEPDSPPATKTNPIPAPARPNPGAVLHETNPIPTQVHPTARPQPPLALPA